MDGRRSQPLTHPDIAGEAESLIRALRGVTHARIRSSERGIESIHVTASDDAAATHMAAHVRSALLAGLAAPVTPARIHVAVAHGPAQAPDSTTPPVQEPADTFDAPATTDPAEPPPPRDRLRLLHSEPAPPATPEAPAPEAEHTLGHGPAAAPEPPITARPRLVAVDADRPGDGRVICRVSVAYGTRVHRAEAVAVDLPGSAAQAAAQAAVRALIDAGLAGIELCGLREVEIAGRDYVLVALRRTEPFARTRSGSAPIIGSAERSAAEATVAAAHELS